MRLRFRRDVWLLAAFSACVGEPLNLGHDSWTLTTPTSQVVVPQDGKTQLTINVQSNLRGSEKLDNLQVTITPSSSGFMSPAMANGHDGTITLGVTGAPPPAGTYVMTVTATSGQSPPISTQIEVDVAVVASVALDPTGSQGVNGHLQESMGTSFQPADWQYQFFSQSGQSSGGSGGTPQTLLTQLAPQHILIQLMNGGAIPLVGWTNSSSDWNFDELDALVQPILRSAQAIGAQVELQIKDIPTLPGGMLTNTEFATYCEDLVHYYNDPMGFTWGGTMFRSPSGIHIPWWGILSDWNGSGSPIAPDGAAYAAIYNAVVPPMQAVDPTIHFSAFEFAVFYGTDGQPAGLLPAFLKHVMAPVDAISLHLYGTDVPWDDPNHFTDTMLFGTVPSLLVPALTYVVSATQPDPTQVWVTQNNVNSNAPSSTGDNPSDSLAFANDPRGTSAFFAAWRPYVFAELGKAGNQALNHWEFTAGYCPPPPPGTTSYCATPVPGMDPASLDTDDQNAEVDYTSVEPRLSYWVDQALGRMFASTPAPALDASSDGSSNTSLDATVDASTDGGSNAGPDATASADGGSGSSPDAAADAGPPATGGAPSETSGPTLLQVKSSESNVPGDGGLSVDVLATENVDGSIVVMVVDIAPEDAGTFNGNGQPRTVIVDLSSLLSALPAQTFSQGSTLTIDGTTDAGGPSQVVLDELPTAMNGYRVQLTLLGYGVTFLKLTP